MNFIILSSFYPPGIAGFLIELKLMKFPLFQRTKYKAMEVYMSKKNIHKKLP